MTEYALLIDGEFREIRNYAERPVDIPHKAVEWYPVFRTSGPEAFSGLGDDQWIIQTIDPSTLPPEVPQVISARQVRLILLQQGLLETVKAMIEQQEEAVRIEWEYATEFRRDNPLLTGLAANLGLTDEQIDEFFIAASQF